MWHFWDHCVMLGERGAEFECQYLENPLLAAIYAVSATLTFSIQRYLPVTVNVMAVLVACVLCCCRQRPRRRSRL